MATDVYACLSGSYYYYYFFFIFAYQNVSSKKEGFLSALFIAVSTEPRMVPGTY